MRLLFEAGFLQATEDRAALFRIDMAVGGGRRDHGADEDEGRGLGRGLRLEAGAGRRRQYFLLGCVEQRLAGLIVLVGLVGEAADQGEAAELGCGAGDRAARAGAEDERAETAEHGGGQRRVAGEHALGLLDELVRRPAAGDPAECFAGALLHAGLARRVAKALRRLGQDLSGQAADPARALDLIGQSAEHAAEAALLPCLRAGLAAGIDQGIEQGFGIEHLGFSCWRS